MDAVRDKQYRLQEPQRKTPKTESDGNRGWEANARSRHSDITINKADTPQIHIDSDMHEQS